jgi:type IV pilus assembly protein PilF
MRRWHGFGLLSAGLALLACSNDPAKEPNERRPTDLYVLKGVQYLENGRLDVAVEDLKHAIELDEGNAEAHNALGVAYERLNQADEAERQYQRALALDENHFAAANNYGRLLCAEGKYDQAMKRFQSVIDSLSYPTPWLALTNAGLCAKA